MKKKQLLELLAQYPDDAWVVIDVDDTIHEDLYDFTFEPVSWTTIDGQSNDKSTSYGSAQSMHNESVHEEIIADLTHKVADITYDLQVVLDTLYRLDNEDDD